MRTPVQLPLLRMWAMYGYLPAGVGFCVSGTWGDAQAVWMLLQTATGGAALHCAAAGVAAWCAQLSGGWWFLQRESWNCTISHVWWVANQSRVRESYGTVSTRTVMEAEVLQPLTAG